MRIDLLHYAAPPTVGGVESVLKHHASLMADNGHAVRILAGRGEQWDERIPLITIPLADSRHETVLAIKAILDSGKVPKKFHKAVSAIENHLMEVVSGTDVLIAHNVCSLNKNLALTAALKNLWDRNPRFRLILWHHDLAWTTPRYVPELYAGYPWDLLHMDWHNADQITVSKTRQRELAELIGCALERITVIPNGLDIKQFFKLDGQTSEIIAKYNLLEAEPLLLLPVRITPRKNIEKAFFILTELMDFFPHPQLVVTGPLGPHNPANVEYYKMLLSLREALGITASAHLLAEYSQEFLPDSVISDLYQISDALLFPSQEEGFGIPILEAGISRVPIFCADIPPLRELGLQDVHYFSPNSDPNDIARLISKILCRDAGYRLRIRVKKGYTWDQIYSLEIEPMLVNLSKRNE